MNIKKLMTFFIFLIIFIPLFISLFGCKAVNTKNTEIQGSRIIFFNKTICSSSNITTNFLGDSILIKGGIRIREALCMDLTPTYKIENNTLIFNVETVKTKFGFACKDKNAYTICYEAKINLKDLKRVKIFHNNNLQKEINIG